MSGVKHQRQSTGNMADESATLLNKSSHSGLQQERATSQQITVNLITGGLGAGILSLPWSTAGSSIIPSLLIIAGVLILNGWTIMILVRAADHKQAFDLGSVLSHLPGRMGPAAQIVCNIMVWVSMFMCLVSYFIVLADSMVPFTAGTILARREVAVAIIASVALPLSFLDLRSLSWTSCLAVVGNVYIFMLLIGLYTNQPAPVDVCIMGLSRGNVAMVSAMMQAVIIQMCVLPMYQQLENRTPQKFLGIVSTAFCALFAIFSGFSVVAYLTFGPMVHGNLLLDLPHSVWGNMGRAAASISVLAVFPIMVMPMIAPVKKLERQGGMQFACLVATVGIVIMVSITAFFVRDLGFMNVINGATCVGFFVALFPALVGLYILERRDGIVWKIAMFTLLAFGFTMSALGFLYTDNYVADVSGHCLLSVKER